MLEAFLLLQLPRKMSLPAGTVGQPTRACLEMGACPIAPSSSLAPDQCKPSGKQVVIFFTPMECKGMRHMYAGVNHGFWKYVTNT